MSYDLVIFDCDGVLVDSEPIIIRIFVKMLGEFGYTVDYNETLRDFSGTSMATKLEVVRDRLAWSAPPEFAGESPRQWNAN